MVDTSPYDLLSALAVVSALILGESNRNDVFFTSPAWIGEVVTLFGTISYYAILTVLVGAISSMYFHRSAAHQLLVTPHISTFAIAIFFYFLQSCFSEVAYSYRQELQDFHDSRSKTLPHTLFNMVEYEDETTLESVDISRTQQNVVYAFRAIPHFLFGVFILPYLAFLRYASRRSLQARSASARKGTR